MKNSFKIQWPDARIIFGDSCQCMFSWQLMRDRPCTPTYAPSASCADDATWSYGTKASNTCAYVARKLKRCKAKNTDGFRNALEACPLTCGTC